LQGFGFIGVVEMAESASFSRSSEVYGEGPKDCQCESESAKHSATEVDRLTESYVREDPVDKHVYVVVFVHHKP
jgi:hypothetical protein